MDCWFRAPASNPRHNYLLPCYCVWSIPPFCLGHPGVRLFQIWNRTFTKMQGDEFVHVRWERQHTRQRALTDGCQLASVFPRLSQACFSCEPHSFLCFKTRCGFSRVFFKVAVGKSKNLPVEPDDLCLIDLFNYLQLKNNEVIHRMENWKWILQ